MNLISLRNWKYNMFSKSYQNGSLSFKMRFRGRWFCWIRIGLEHSFAKIFRKTRRRLFRSWRWENFKLSIRNFWKPPRKSRVRYPRLWWNQLLKIQQLWWVGLKSSRIIWRRSRKTLNIKVRKNLQPKKFSNVFLLFGTPSLFQVYAHLILQLYLYIFPFERWNRRSKKQETYWKRRKSTTPSWRQDWWPWKWILSWCKWIEIWWSSKRISKSSRSQN